MKKLNVFGVVALSSSFLWGVAAHAQMGMQQPQIRGIFNPTVGSGAAYELDKDDGTKMPIEMSIVGKESVEGKDGYWLETTMKDPKSQNDVTMKMLLVSDGANSHVDKMVIMIPGRGAMSMPVGMMRGRGPQQPEDIRDKANDLGKESVTTAAGTFNCEHYQMKDEPTDIWVSSDVKPYGLVKMVSKKDNTSMVLTKTLTGVQDKITGPVMDMSQMMRGMSGMGAPPQQ